MRWEDERWIKSYTRETGSWMCLSWQARGLADELMKKCDGAGIIELGRKGLPVVAALMRATFTELEPYLRELLDDGCLVLEGDHLIFPNFVEAQEAKTSDAEKKRRQRWLDRDSALSKSPDFEQAMSPAVTGSHPASPHVTGCPQPEETRQDQKREIREDLYAPPSANAPEGKPPKAEKPTDPRRAPLIASLVAVFAEVRGAAYTFDGKRDGAAVNALLARASDDEILARWRCGLTRQGFHGCTTIHELAEVKRWNALAGTGPPSGAGGPRGVLPPSPPEAFKNRGKLVPIT